MVRLPNSAFRGRIRYACSAAMPAAQYPMHVLPVARLLQLQRLPTHEEIKDELVEQREGMQTVFVSQTWLPRSPRQRGQRKAEAVAELLARRQKRASGRRSSPRSSGEASSKFRPRRSARYNTYGSTSSASHRLTVNGRARRSLRSQITSSEPRFLSASPARGVTRAARSATCVRGVRGAGVGWSCYAICSHLRQSRQIVLQSPSDVRSHGSAGLFGRNWIISPVGRGEFTVEADRVALGPVIERLIDERMAAKRAEGTEAALRWYRFLHAHKASLLLGTGINVTPYDTPRVLAGAFAFSSATSRDGHGWSPLSYAVLEGRVDLVTALLDAGANATGALRRDEPAFLCVKGMSNLHLAAMRCDEDDSTTVESIIGTRARRRRRPEGHERQLLPPFCVYIGSNFVHRGDSQACSCPQGRADVFRRTRVRLSCIEWPRGGARALHGPVPRRFPGRQHGCPAGWVNYACELVGDLDLISMLIAGPRRRLLRRLQGGAEAKKDPLGQQARESAAEPAAHDSGSLRRGLRDAAPPRRLQRKHRRRRPVAGRGGRRRLDAAPAQDDTIGVPRRQRATARSARACLAAGAPGRARWSRAHAVRVGATARPPNSRERRWPGGGEVQTRWRLCSRGRCSRRPGHREVAPARAAGNQLA